MTDPGPVDPNICAQMRADWNSRAQEDAHYYVAFGRRDQSEDEFFDTAADLVKSLELELKRFPKEANRKAWRALEIGCGPGRLMRPMSRYFGEIHGVDVSDEMIRLARERLRGIPHAHVHATSGADLAAFADDSFQMVYSYAVFQHIPSREVVFQYLREARRVLKAGGLLRCQINGLPESAARYDTWSGVRISGADASAFAAAHDFQLLALEGVATQYMWTTWRKRAAGWTRGLTPDAAPPPARVRRVTNAHSSEPVAPPSGRFASISLWVEDLPADCDLNSLDVLVGGRKGFGTYIGPPESDGLQQVNALLPEGLETGVHAVQLRWLGSVIAPPAKLRVIPRPPAVPRIVSVSDGIDLLAGMKIVTGFVKVTIEEVAQPESLEVLIDGRAVAEIDVFCTDPRLPRHEVNFTVPADVEAGPHRLDMRLGTRRFAPVRIEITPRSSPQA
jgi:SAM-dependent methyltransferase